MTTTDLYARDTASDSAVDDLIDYLSAARPSWKIHTETSPLWKQHLGCFSRADLEEAGRAWVQRATSKDVPMIGDIRGYVMNLRRGSTFPDELQPGAYEAALERRPDLDLADAKVREQYDLWAAMVPGSWQYFSQAHAIFLAWKVPGEGNEPTTERLERIRNAED